MASILQFFFRGAARRQVHGRSPTGEPQAREPLPGTVKSDLSPKGLRRYFEVFIEPIRDADRLFVVILMVGAVAVAEGFALAALIPLHEKVPYLAEISEEDGKLHEVGKFKRVSTENITQRQIDYFLKSWTRWLLTIDSQTRVNLSKTASWVRGAAVNELNDWLEKVDRPGERQAKEPNLTREVTKTSFTYGQGKTVFLHIELLERNAGVETRRYKKILQFDYDLLPEQLADDNPIGLAIVHFTIGDE